MGGLTAIMRPQIDRSGKRDRSQTTKEEVTRGEDKRIGSVNA
jgi:hypothetical protein